VPLDADVVARKPAGQVVGTENPPHGMRKPAACHAARLAGGEMRVTSASEPHA